MVTFVTWVGWTVIIIVGVAAFCFVQWLLNGVVLGQDPGFDWSDTFLGTLLLAMIVWLPGSLGWFFTAAQSVGG